MKYAFFDADGRVESSHNDDTVATMPDGAVGLSDGEWDRRFDLLFDGGVLTDSPEPTPALTPDAVLHQYTDAIQARLDAFARTRNYDGILSACTYATSAVPQFAAEGQYAVSARDATWAQGYSILADVRAGTRPAPTVDELFDELPALAWP
jgi:hypothetical protein